MGMIDVLRKQWRYFTAKTESRFEANADPKVQLEQAISDAQTQHSKLVDQAASVVANQKQTEIRLNRAMEDLEKINNSTRQALLMAQQAQAAGDASKAAEYNQTAEAFANRLVATEKQVQDLKTLSLQSAQASDQARAAVQQNSLALQQKLAERQKLMSQLDQAKMQEQLNTAMSSLSQTAGSEGPTLDQVRDKIEARYAKAVGTSELTGTTVEARMLEVEQASIGSEARSRLDAIRAEMGGGGGAPGQLTGAPAAGGELGAAPSTAAEPAPAPGPAADAEPEPESAGEG